MEDLFFHFTEIIKIRRTDAFEIYLIRMSEAKGILRTNPFVIYIYSGL